MPGRDKTGPSGQGPGTGRGLGGCITGEPVVAGNFVRGFGYGAGRGGRPWGGGRGRCFGGGRGRIFGAGQSVEMTAEQENAVLENQVAFLEEQTNAIKKRIDDLKPKKEKTTPKKKT